MTFLIWWRKKMFGKEKIIETSVGKISKSTLKHQQAMVRTMFNDKIEELSDEYSDLHEIIVEKIEEFVKEKYGKHTGCIMIGGHIYCIHTKESKKKLKEFTTTIIKKTELLKSVDEIRNLEEEKERLGL